MNSDRVGDAATRSSIRATSPIDASFSHHLDEISEAQFKPEKPTHTDNDDLPIEMAALEDFVDAQHAGLPS